jgi:hypothetical protein
VISTGDDDGQIISGKAPAATAAAVDLFFDQHRHAPAQEGLAESLFFLGSELSHSLRARFLDQNRHRVWQHRRRGTPALRIRKDVKVSQRQRREISQ